MPMIAISLKNKEFIYDSVFDEEKFIMEYFVIAILSK
jgi:hypothetical protein